MGDGAEAALSRTMIERVLTACSAFGSAEIGQLMALLRRFQAEAAREEARVMSAQLAEREEQSRKAMVIEIDFESLEAELLEAA